ncbi:KOW motif-containing protein [Pseudobutyrivibrio sp.]|uniref:KOW motif-containing protein n=1 Tax=Pseudobutyrivibrio sp. TaxID=2014367 RepID=UPI001B49036A|nr:KOW motif-containing protein [Pseudobutyrivibrio sp.]MBP3261219.1 KOW motif-containing protein [Pseudobutyrivibrio sp.]
MTWEEYYDKFYDWAESTQIKKLSSVEKYGSAEEVTEIMMEFAFDHEDIVNRMARKAIEQKIVFSAENIRDLTNFVDPSLQARLAIQSVGNFSRDDLELLDGFLDDDVLVKLYRSKGLKVLEMLDDGDYDNLPSVNMDEVMERAKQPTGFFSKLAMAFGIGAGIHQGLSTAGGKKNLKFRVGDHVRVRYRGQEGTIIDINGDMYMVSLADGSHVDSFYENQLERAW